jgi:hypothetical protein
MTFHPDEDQPEEPERLDRVSSGDLAYRSDLTERVLARWRDAKTAGEIDVPLPFPGDLATILSVCYHASLLREEGRPVTFRLAAADLVHPVAQEAKARARRAVDETTCAIMRRRILAACCAAFGRIERLSPLAPPELLPGRDEIHPRPLGPGCGVRSSAAPIVASGDRGVNS